MNTKRQRVLICDPIHPDGVAMLRQRATVDIAEKALSEEELIERIGAYQGVVVRSRTKIPASVIAAAHGLQVIARAGAGLDSIDVDAAQSHGIEVVNAPNANTLAVAEHTFGLILALARKIVQADRGLKEGRWEKSKLLGTGLAGKTLGIIGFGRIGRQVAKRAKAFDMQVLVNQPRLTPELALEFGVEKVDLTDLLRQSDFVTLHVPMRPENVGLIGEEELALMKPTAYLINTARGGIVEESALLHALEENRIAGAGLDVFQGEPHVMPELVQHPKVVATPHIAASTEDAQRQAAITVAEQVLAVLDRTGSSETLSLKVVPIESVVPHESHDPKRVDELAARLQDDGFLVNPPVVAAWGSQYVVLDGATRLTAFKKLGYPHIIVQQVDLRNSEVQLHTWYHAVRGGTPDDLVQLLQSVPHLHVRETDVSQLQKAMLEKDVLGYLLTSDGRGFLLEAAELDESNDWLQVLNDMVAAYTHWGHVSRTLTTDVSALSAQFADFNGVFVFPQFTPEQVLEMAGQGRTMPAGITRFVIPGRVLRLNAPLQKLASQEPLAAKSAWLDRFVQQKLHFRKVRYYQEPVVILDE